MTPEELKLPAFNFDPNYKPPKCQHCGLERGKHRAVTLQCPAKWSKGRIGFTHYLETVFIAREKKVRK